MDILDAFMSSCLDYSVSLFQPTETCEIHFGLEILLGGTDAETIAYASFVQC